MKKLLIITFSLLLLMSASLMATGTRVGTMGNNNMILLDDANIWMFPSRINDYPRMAVAEFSDDYYTDFGEFGIHWQFNEENPCVLGTYFFDWTTMYPGSSPFYSPYSSYSMFGHSSRFVPFDHSLYSNRRIDLFYGRQLGGNPFGIHLSLINSSHKEEDPTDLDEEGFSVYDFSFGWTLGGNTDIAAGLEFMSWTHKETYQPIDTVDTYANYDETKPKGNMALYAGIRHFMPTGDPDYTLVPHAMLYYGKNKAEYYYNTTGNGYDYVVLLDQTNEYKTLAFDFGAGLQYAPSSDVMAVLDFGIRYDKLTGDFVEKNNLWDATSQTFTTGTDSVSDASAKTFTLPYFKVGLDAKVFNWMDVRFGATTYWDRHTDEGNDWNATQMKNSANWAENDTYLGFGFHWGNLHVDTYTDPHLFLRGFDFISGSGEGGSDMNFSLSALYEFE